MSNLRSLFIGLGSLALVASLGAACGHDELLIGQGSGSGGENTGGVASKAGGPDASSGGSPAGGGTTSSGGGSSDAASDGLAGSAGAPHFVLRRQSPLRVQRASEFFPANFPH